MPAKKFRIHYVLFGLVLGVIVGALGTALHRTAPPWGLVLALVATASLVVAMRSLMGWTGLLSAVIGWAVIVQFLALGRKSGDVLIAGDGLGYGWLLGGILCLFIGLLLPFSLFHDDKSERVAEQHQLDTPKPQPIADTPSTPHSSSTTRTTQKE